MQISTTMRRKKTELVSWCEYFPAVTLKTLVGAPLSIQTCDTIISCVIASGFMFPFCVQTNKNPLKLCFYLHDDTRNKKKNRQTRFQFLTKINTSHATTRSAP